MFFLAKFYRSDKRESLTWKFKNSVYCLSYRRQQLKLYWPEGQYSWHPIRALKIFSIKLSVVLRLFAMWVRKGIALITRGDKLLSFFILLFDRSKLSLRRCERSSSCEQHVIINLYYCDLSWGAHFYRCGLGSLLSLLSSPLEDEESTRLLCELCGSRKGKKRERNFGYRVVKERIPRVYAFMTKGHFP